MIRLAGLEPDEDIEIRFTGVRPGEKLFEEMFHDSEGLITTSASDILLAAPRMIDLAKLNRRLTDLESNCRSGRADGF